MFPPDTCHSLSEFQTHTRVALGVCSTFASPLSRCVMTFSIRISTSIVLYASSSNCDSVLPQGAK